MSEASATAETVDLDFTIEGAEVVRHAAMPQLAFKLRVRHSPGALPCAVQAVTLRCQLRIDPLRRRYPESAGEALRDLFGTPDRWSQTMHSMLWQHISFVVPPFDDTIVVDLPVPCSFDFNLAATRYFHALDEGDIPLSFYFSGTIFYHGPDDQLQVTQISWEKEAQHRLPVATWRAMMEHYYPNNVWLCLSRDLFDQLLAAKAQNSLPGWDEALRRVLTGGERSVTS